MLLINYKYIFCATIDTARFNFEDGTLQGFYLDTINSAQGITLTVSEDFAIGSKSARVTVNFTGNGSIWNQAGIVVDNQIPSQNISAKVYLPAGAPSNILAKIFLQDTNWQLFESTPVFLAINSWTDLNWDISSTIFNNPVKRLGIIIGSISNYSGFIYVDSIDFITATFTATPTATPTRTATMTYTPALPSPTFTVAIGYGRIEGENPCYLDGFIENLNGGYEGTGYANPNNAVGTKIIYSLNAINSTTIDLLIRYANGSENNRNMELYINGQLAISNIDFPTTGNWNTWIIKSISINLNKGYNELEFNALSSEGGPNFDYIAWVSELVSNAGCVVPSATPTMTNTPTMTCTPINANLISVSNYDLMPASVSTEQKDVYAVMFKIKNPSSGIATIKGITLTVKDKNSNTITASAVITSVGIRDENTFYFNTSISTIDSFIWCPILLELNINQYSEKNIYIVLGITNKITDDIKDFKIEINSPSDIFAVDYFTGNSLTVVSSSGFSFPMGSSVTYIQNKATELRLNHLNTMPNYISTDQKNIKAMQLNFENTGNTMTASIKISRITFYIKDFFDNLIPASSVIKKIKITSIDESFIYGESEATTTSKVTILLTAPLIVPATQSVSCALLFDVATNYSSSSIKITLENTGDLYAVDTNSSVPVIISSLSNFPKQTTAAVIQEKLNSIIVDNFLPLLPLGVVKGQRYVSLFNFRVYNNSNPLSAKAEFNSITITVKNDSGLPLSANSALEKLYITDSLGNTLGSAIAGVGSEVYLKLITPYIFSYGQSQYFRLFADILSTAFAPNFKIALQDAGNISIVDANSKYEVIKSNSPDFPWETEATGIFMAPATDLYIWHNSNIAPTMVGIGQPNVKFMILYYFNPGTPGTSDVLINGITFTVKDLDSNIIDPSKIFKSIYITDLNENITYAYYTDFSNIGNNSFFINFERPFLSDVLNTKTAYVSGDISLYAKEGVYKLEINSQEYISRFALPYGYVTVTAVNADVFPFESNPVTITALAYNFKIGHKDLMPVSVAQGSSGVDALSLKFENYNAIPIAVTSIAIAVKECSGKNISANSVLKAIKLQDRENNLIITINPGSENKINITPINYIIPSGAEREIKVIVDIIEAAEEPFYLELETGEDVKTLPLASVNPAEGDYFGNMKSGCVSIQEKSLINSFHSFPNPFNPQKQNMKIEYYLEQDAEVTIKIWTINGNLVKTIIEKAVKKKGLHYEDVWDGKNQSGKDVISGVYLYSIEVKDKIDKKVVKLTKKVVVLK